MDKQYKDNLKVLQKCTVFFFCLFFRKMHLKGNCLPYPIIKKQA